MKLVTIGGRKIPYGGVLGEPRSRKVKKGAKRSEIAPTRLGRPVHARLEAEKARAAGFCAKFFAAKSIGAFKGRNALVLGLEEVRRVVERFDAMMKQAEDNVSSVAVDAEVARTEEDIDLPF